MSRDITAAELRVFKPDTMGIHPDFVIPQPDIESYSVSRRAGERASSGSVAIHNDGGQYSTGATELAADDKLEFWVSYPESGIGNRFLAGRFFPGPFGSGPTRRVHTAVITTWDITGPKDTSKLDFDVESFVWNRLAERQVLYAETDRPIAGSEDAHLDSILREFAPGVDRSGLPTIDARIDYAADGVPAERVVSRLAQFARAQTGRPYVPAAWDDRLLFRDVSALEAGFDSPARADTDADFGELSSTGGPPSANEIRVEGGLDDVGNVDDSQETVSSYQTVTSSSRITRRVRSRKPELTKIEVNTRALSGSEDKLRVRIQADDGGVPVAPDDADSDLQSGTAETQPSGTGDWQTVRLGEYTLAPQGNPWLIIEADGSDGIEVGVDGTGVPAYRVYFPKPVIVRVGDEESKSTYRLHERIVEDDALVTFDAALQRARAELSRRANEVVQVSGTALSDRAHALHVGDVVPMEFDWLRANGDFILTQRSMGYDANAGSRLDVGLTFEGYDSYA